MMTALPPIAPGIRATLAGAFAQWLRTHQGAIAMAGVLAMAGPVTFFAGALSVMRSPTASVVAELGLWWALYGAILWCLLLAAGEGCGRLTRRFGRLLSGVTCLLSACSVAALANLLTAGRAAILLEQGLVHSAATMYLHGFTFALIMALLFFAHLRRSREHARAAARLGAAQTAQRQARRRMVQSRLQEVQARVEPQLLFDMLDTARGLYARDAALGERFLDELIAFLRAALPRLRSASSSLLREAELASAFVRLHALAGRSGGGITIEIAPEARHARFPPGVLLPLLDTAVGSSAGPCRLRAIRSGDVCRLDLELGAPPAPASVARVQSRLAELYGASGKLELEGTSGPIHLIVEVPHELA